MFSMFGGGAKKEKKEDEERGDNSGSAKAQRDADAAAKAGDEVRTRYRAQTASRWSYTDLALETNRRRHQSPRMSTSSPLSV
jgi:hypothetical protein